MKGAKKQENKNLRPSGNKCDLLANFWIRLIKAYGDREFKVLSSPYAQSVSKPIHFSLFLSLFISLFI